MENTASSDTSEMSSNHTSDMERNLKWLDRINEYSIDRGCMNSRAVHGTNSLAGGRVDRK